MQRIDSISLLKVYHTPAVDVQRVDDCLRDELRAVRADAHALRQADGEGGGPHGASEVVQHLRARLSVQFRDPIKCELVFWDHILSL